MIGTLIALAVAWWVWPRVRTIGLEIPEPARGLGIREAHDRGMALARSGDALAAVPYFRRVVALRPDSWNAHVNLAGALGNGVMQSRTHLGKAEIGTRTSIERVEMMRESIRETEAAEGQVESPIDRATVLFERARALQTWGFPYEALVFFRLAYASAPQRPEMAAALRGAQEAFLTTGGAGP